MGEPLDLEVLRTYFREFNEQLQEGLDPEMKRYFGSPTVDISGNLGDIQEGINRLAAVYHPDLPVDGCKALYSFCREVSLYFTATNNVPSYNTKIILSQLTERTPGALVEKLNEYSRVTRTLRERAQQAHGTPTELSMPAVTDDHSTDKN